MPSEVAVTVRGQPRRGLLYLPMTPPSGLVLFVHGSGHGTAENFARYTDQLVGFSVACLVVDKVMDGYSAARRRYDRLAVDAQDMLCWARGQDQLSGLPTALLGYSEGSWVAAKAAVQRPDLVDILVLCSAPLTQPRAQTAFHWANTAPHRPRIVRRLRQGLMWVAMTALTDYGAEDIEADLIATPAPVVLVLGADDTTIQIERAVKIFDRTRHAIPPPIVVPDADHHLPANGDWLSQIATALTDE